MQQETVIQQFAQRIAVRIAVDDRMHGCHVPHCCVIGIRTISPLAFRYHQRESDHAIRLSRDGAL